MRIPAVLATLGLFITPLLAIAQALEVHFLDVGQGDAALIRCPDGKHFGVIDSGDTKYPGSADAFKNYLLSKIKGSTKAITVAISSHVLISVQN